MPYQDGLLGVCMDGCMGRWVGGWLDGWIVKDGWVGKWVVDGYGWFCKWMDG